MLRSTPCFTLSPIGAVDYWLDSRAYSSNIEHSQSGKRCWKTGWTKLANVNETESQKRAGTVLQLQRRFLNTRKAAEYTGIPANTLRWMRYVGVGPKFYKPRGRALYDVADLNAFMDSGRRVPSS